MSMKLGNQKENTKTLSSFRLYRSELKYLNIETRNKVRAIIASEGKYAIRLINKLRKERNSHEIVKIEKALRLQLISGKAIVPQDFPQKPQTSENYIRLSTLTIEKYLKFIERICQENAKILDEFFELSLNLNKNIIKRDFKVSDDYIGRILKSCGYSHYLLRKAALLKAVNTDGIELPCVDNLFSEAGLGSNNTIASSVLQSFQEEQDFLIMKRSIMSIRDKGSLNRFTRDLTRIPFHPHARDEDDLCEMLQSNLQSSVIDAIIVLKTNERRLKSIASTVMLDIFSQLDTVGCDIDEIAGNYINSGGEDLFYKHSSAWLENADVVTYRILQDHFNDAPESEYLCLDHEIIETLKDWVKDIDLSELAYEGIFTRHNKENLSQLEKEGLTSRSAVYNYLIFLKEGYQFIPEESLILLMEKTKDLHKTINIDHHARLALNTKTSISKIIIYLLIAKKSKNEKDNYALRRHIQSFVRENYNGSLVEFIKSLEKKSNSVAIYAYETCTEDFIAKLSHLISSPYAITETRASLHQWMGILTGEQVYIDRARALLIDHQINRIRNEIDDNRIYVDSARFSEWVNDEITRDLDAVLSSIEHNNLGDSYDVQLYHIIEKCYSNFCHNNIFGIASYLGRRIRHGTFKGHLYSSVVAIEDNYTELLKDLSLVNKWERWKKNYEICIDRMIRDYLHVESTSKPNGLIKPNIKDVEKSDTVLACSHKLVTDFNDSKTSAGAPYILTEYCWRLIEYDLKNIKSFMKGRKSELMQSDLLGEFKHTKNISQQNAARDFARDVQRHVNDKLIAMYGWFNRPASVSPKASIFLLYKAVVAEVKETYPHLEADTDFDVEQDIVLAGGAYHVLYDAFYVVVFNAAKHGKADAAVKREIHIEVDKKRNKSYIVVTISSELTEKDDEHVVAKRLSISPGENIDNAHLFEGRSGIRKLYHLQTNDDSFMVKEIMCKDRYVTIELAYKLEHV